MTAATARLLIKTAVLVAALLLSGCAASAGPDASASDTTPLSDEQLIQDTIDQAWAGVVARYPSSKRPDVGIVRLISIDEWPQVMADCLHDEGFVSVTVGDDGGIQSGEIPGAQAQAYVVAQYVCNAKYPLDPKYNRALSDEQLDILYDYYSGELTECLEGLGYEVSDPPSRQSFRDTYETAPWLPFSDAVGQATSADKLHEVETTCPQTPDNLWG